MLNYFVARAVVGQHLRFGVVVDKFVDNDSDTVSLVCDSQDGCYTVLVRKLTNGGPLEGDEVTFDNKQDALRHAMTEADWV